jgi:hypothetical protein
MEVLAREESVSVDFRDCRKIVISQEGKLCEVYFEAKSVPDEWKEKLWAIYEYSMHVDESIQEQSCYGRPEFMSVLGDEGYGKTVLFVDDEIAAFGLSTRNVDMMIDAYLNPRYIRKHFRQELEENRFIYILAICVSPGSRNIMLGKTLLWVAIRELHEKNYVLGMDVCMPRDFMIPVIKHLGEETGYPVEDELLGTQSYFLLRRPS